MRLQGPRSPHSGAAGFARAPFVRRETVSITWRRLVALCAAAVLTGSLAAAFSPAALAAGSDPCGPGSNPVACENSKPGTPASEWDIVSAAGSRVQGFATATSVQPGQPVSFKIKATSSYTVDVYRLGYYGGDGARRQAPTWTVPSPVSQPACATDPSTFNYDCGTWSVSTQWQVPADAVSGVYIAKLTMGTDESEIPFVVRDDSRRSDVVMKTSDATWQAYNDYGGSDFYTAPSSLTGTQARAFKISYNRPYATRDSSGGRDFLYSNEYPTLRFLERNGIDVSYTTDVDVSTGATDLTQHKTFVSVGHDEYWSGAERSHIEAARDAGVNLMFLSGNEGYWHTRLEPSIDGSATANRTIVCYKDSWESTKIDPGAGTPTWRDPAQPAPAGSQPENALTGTMYMSNDTDLAITVSAKQGKARLWRNTSLATLPDGTTQTLAPHTIGYESDEDVDNGHRPAGLMRLTETTGPTDQAVQNAAGTQVAPGTTTHSLTLYRASSGALVFGAGTIQWGWGLDQYHDGDNSNPADPRMQQATLNMLADMGAAPTTLMSGMVQPTGTDDTTAPTVAITAPGTGASLGNGAMVTVSGTASDAAVVTNVEVSLDGGTTFHRAVGTTSWSYSGVVSGSGASTIKVRASDDSANLSAPVSVGVTVSCPCSLFGERVPDVSATSDASNVELGVRFVPAADGFVSGIRFFKGAGNTGIHTGTLWTSAGTPLASGTFTGESSSGWQTLVFDTAVPVTNGTTYVASYNAPQGHYAATPQFFRGSDWSAPPLTARGSASGESNGVYAGGHGFPTQSYANTNYWVDAVYSLDATTPPTVSRVSPLNGAASVARTVRPSATFAATVDPASITMSLVDAQGTAVPGAMAFDPATRTVRYTPDATLSYGATYRAAVQATSGTGVPMAAPYSWSFAVSLTDPLPGLCPCSIWPDSATPATPSTGDTGSVQLGVKFRADVDGAVEGVRFYKGPLNLGSHTGSLWTSSGTLLATVTFTDESSTGWQTAFFSSAVDITADSTYIVSYTAPAGGYAVTTGGLATTIDSGPLHTIAGGGVYTYGTGAPLTASSTNYWVDLVFTATDAAPTVASTQPGDGATNVNVAEPISATLNGFVQSGTARIEVERLGTPVTGATSYAPATRTLTFQPTSPLQAGTTYTATVSGATALSGNVMSPYSWQFTTAGVASCPCSLFSSSAVPATPDAGDPGAVELGVGFTPSTDGQVTGLRFYKSTLNTGIHTGTLWSSGGSVLATGTFTGESASGWQTLVFSSPVAVAAGTTYVVSYHAPNGHYSATPGFFAQPYANGPLSAVGGNGRYAYGPGGVLPTGTYGSTNYWVDPTFRTGTPPDTTAPVVSGTAPVAGATSQPVTSTPTATFTEDIVPSSLGFSLSTSNGSVSGAASYDSTTRTATFTPTSPLGAGTTYTASVTAADAAGNPISPARSWSFTTSLADPEPGTCPCSLWTDSTAPTTMSDPDTTSIELGTRFSADTDGSVAGVRFYKAPDNTGVHPVSLWSDTGVRLATATPTSESSTGWQTAAFATPVAVTAGTSYVVSYLAPNGRYSSLVNGLSTPRDRPPLHTLASAGRYAYGPGGFPGERIGRELPRRPLVHDGLRRRIRHHATGDLRGLRDGVRHHRDGHLDHRRGGQQQRVLRHVSRFPHVDGHEPQRHLALGEHHRLGLDHAVPLPGLLRRCRRQLQQLAGSTRGAGHLHHTGHGCTGHLRGLRDGVRHHRDSHLDHRRGGQQQRVLRHLSRVSQLHGHRAHRHLALGDHHRAGDRHHLLLPGHVDRCRRQLQHLTGATRGAGNVRHRGRHRALRHRSGGDGLGHHGDDHVVHQRGGHQLGRLRHLGRLPRLHRHGSHRHVAHGHAHRPGAQHALLLPGHLGRPVGQQHHLARRGKRPGRLHAAGPALRQDDGRRLLDRNRGLRGRRRRWRGHRRPARGLRAQRHEPAGGATTHRARHRRHRDGRGRHGDPQRCAGRQHHRPHHRQPGREGQPEGGAVDRLRAQ